MFDEDENDAALIDLYVTHLSLRSGFIRFSYTLVLMMVKTLLYLYLYLVPCTLHVDPLRFSGIGTSGDGPCLC